MVQNVLNEHTRKAIMDISRFEISALFGRYNVNLLFQDNNLVLVGENGSGKSTILGILYYFLSRQWSRLAEMPFTNITATINGESLSISREDVRMEISSSRHSASWMHLRHKIGLSRAELLRSKLSQFPSEKLLGDPSYVYQIAAQYEVDGDVLLDAVMQDIRNRRLGRTGTRDRALQDVSAQLESLVGYQILFLPTFRRIERDLKYIFPHIQIEKAARSYVRANVESAGFVELVEFGMKDVELSFSTTMARLDREFRADLSSLTGEYLRDIIRSAHAINDYASLLASPTALPVDAVVRRMGDSILHSTERQQLADLILKIRTTGIIPPGREVVAHFLSMLLQMHERQQEREKGVRQLVDICNSYLRPSKQLRFDSQKFELSFHLEGLPPTEPVLPPDALSSGEKQIVSLFTHLYLSEQEQSERKKYFVIIDEPELSISVDWQRRFVEDIRLTPFCKGLVAVTHSPFIFENSLSKYAHSMNEFVTPVGA